MVQGYAQTIGMRSVDVLWAETDRQSELLGPVPLRVNLRLGRLTELRLL